MSYYLHHPSWRRHWNLLLEAQEKLGSSIYDNRCGKTWDIGQAECAELYGPDWMNDPQYKIDNEVSEYEPVPEHIMACAVKLASGYIPEWAQEQPQ